MVLLDIVLKPMMNDEQPNTKTALIPNASHSVQDADFSFSTLAICSDRKVEKVSDVAPPIHLSTTYSMDSDVSDGMIYSRVHNKTRSRVEAVIANLEGSDDFKTVTFSSGQAATSTLLFTLRPKRIFKRMVENTEGDDEAGYAGTKDSMATLRAFANFYCGVVKKELLSKIPATSEENGKKVDDIEDNVMKVIDITKIEEEVDMDQAMQNQDLSPNSKPIYKGDIIWLETPLNPTCDLTDIEYYVKIAHQMGALVIVDSTFASPALQQPLMIGADFALHSTTKFMGGHSDCLGGCVTTKSNGYASSLKSNRSVLGCVMGNLEAYLLLRSLRTLQVRVLHQSQTAEVVAKWLHGQIGNEETNMQVTKVHYPNLAPEQSSQEGLTTTDQETAASTPKYKKLTNYEICQKQMNGKGPGILSFELKTAEGSRKLPQLLEIIEHATSLGGVESCIDYRFQWDRSTAPTLLRLSIGLESPKDLIADLKTALLKL
ncbi:hypothetical protein C9374_001924 [Naegleria lovaniensis]|uniref:Cystathionine gamma-synthase n=1 Tax=Naegleria lovaniensis TaxID=51637 RepID=A0AA88KME6_NAELO|nr:uncharacterized protein C9374_001924 [Naegleria lovaniensis]KAG2386889.1 hypothetical protein C9374_001924 [Naegleria lovaniensis]